MAFYSQARGRLQCQILPEIERRKDRIDGYIHRTLLSNDTSDSFTSDSEGILDSDLVNLSNAVLLGNAGSGKTSAVLHAAHTAIERFIESEEAPYPIYLDLALHLPRQGDFKGKICERAGFDLENVLEIHSPGIHLFIDAVDEAIRHDRRNEGDLKRDLKELQGIEGRVRLLVSCRSGYWQSGNWSRVFADAPSVYKVDQVQSGTYAQIIEDDSSLRNFRRQCKSNGLHHLLESPFDGFDLARRFAETGELPDSRAEHLDRRIDERLTSTAAQSRTADMLSLPRLRDLARLLAVLSTFSNGRAWTQREAVDDLASSPLTSHIQSLQSSEVSALLETRLFKASGVENANGRGEADEVRYAFDHDLYRETLAAQQLMHCSLRKQRTLLCIDLPGETSVAHSFRGTARMLAERSKTFREFLIEVDPVVAVFCETPSLTPSERQRLVEAVLDWCVSMRVTPYSEHLTPSEQIVNRSEKLEDALAQVVPPDPDSILDPMLQGCESEVYWAAEFVREWNRGDSFKTRLKELVDDEDQFAETRATALQVLNDLDDPCVIDLAKAYIDTPADWLRAHAFEIHVERDLANPRDVVKLLSEPLPQEPMFGRGVFRHHVKGHVRSFSQTEVQSALEVLPKPESSSVGQAWLTSVLLCRASEYDLTDIPSRAHAIGADTSVSWTRRSEYVSLLRQHEGLWEEAVHAVSNRLSKDPDWHPYLRLLAEAGSEERISKIKSESDPLNERQAVFLKRLGDEIDRFSTYQNEKTHSTENDSYSRQVSQPKAGSDQDINKGDSDPSPNPEAIYHVIDSNARGLQRVCNVLRAVLIRPEQDQKKVADDINLDDFSSENLRRKLNALEASLEIKVRQILVNEIKRILRDRSQQTTQATPTCAWMKTVALALCDDPPLLGTDVCGLLLRHSEALRLAPTELLETPLFDSLKTEAPERYRRVLCDLVDADTIPLFSVLDELHELEEWSYFEAALTHIERYGAQAALQVWQYALTCAVQQGNLDDLYEAGWTAVCRTLYTGSSVTEQHRTSPIWFKTLTYLMSLGDDKAWKSFWGLVNLNIAPLQSSQWHQYKNYPVPQTELHFQVLTEWALTALERTERGKFDYYGQLCWDLAEHICDHATAEAYPAILHFLRSLPVEEVSTFRGWMQDAIQSIHHQETQHRSPQLLLESVLKDQFSIVQSEADLAEVVLAALDDVQRDYEKGSGVAGFWESEWNPKHETHCQNVLWSQLKPRLRAHGLTHFEEEPYIGPKRSDLRIYCPRSGRDDLEIYLEMKVARSQYERASFKPEKIREQLLEEHMRPSNCRHGIYVVLWLKDPEGQRFELPKTPDSKDDLLDLLHVNCQQINESEHVRIEPFVLDASANFRKK